MYKDVTYSGNSARDLTRSIKGSVMWDVDGGWRPECFIFCLIPFYDTGLIKADVCIRGPHSLSVSTILPARGLMCVRIKNVFMTYRTSVGSGRWLVTRLSTQAQVITRLTFIGALWLEGTYKSFLSQSFGDFVIAAKESWTRMEPIELNVHTYVVSTTESKWNFQPTFFLPNFRFPLQLSVYCGKVQDKTHWPKAFSFLK